MPPGRTRRPTSIRRRTPTISSRRPFPATTDGAAAFALAQTITTLGAANGLGGQSVSNGNLLFGTLPATVVKYQWFSNFKNATRDQERVEMTLRKALFQDKWYQIDE